MRNISKIFESIDGKHTKVTLPTRFRESFSRYLIQRKVQVPPCITEVWNGVESSYTFFVLPVCADIADLIFDDWIDECCVSLE